MIIVLFNSFQGLSVPDRSRWITSRDQLSSRDNITISCFESEGCNYTDYQSNPIDDILLQNASLTLITHSTICAQSQICKENNNTKGQSISRTWLRYFRYVLALFHRHVSQNREYNEPCEQASSAVHAWKYNRVAARNQANTSQMIPFFVFYVLNIFW